MLASETPKMVQLQKNNDLTKIFVQLIDVGDYAGNIDQWTFFKKNVLGVENPWWMDCQPLVEYLVWLFNA